MGKMAARLLQIPKNQELTLFEHDNTLTVALENERFL